MTVEVNNNGFESCMELAFSFELFKGFMTIRSSIHYLNQIVAQIINLSLE